MSKRAAELMDSVTRQIDDIAEAFARLGDPDLAKPDPERKGRTIGDAAAHIAEGYHFLVRFLQSAGYAPGQPAGGSLHGRGPAPTMPGLRKRLDEAKTGVAVVADLTDDQLNSVPPLKSSRFSNGRRSLEQVIEAIVDHQTEHLAELKRAVASPVQAN